MNPLEKFEGKYVVRTKALNINGKTDNSYMSDPIKIEHVMHNHAYYRGRYGSGLNVLAAYYVDENWEECHEEFVKEIEAEPKKRGRDENESE